MAWWNRSKKENPIGKVILTPARDAVFMKSDPKAYAEEAYMRNAIAHRCIKSIATHAAFIDLYVYNEVNGERTRLPDHPLYNLLYKPNPIYDCASFFEAFYSFYQIAGNAYIVCFPDKTIDVRPPSELWLLPPQNVRIVPSETGIPQYFVYEENGKERAFPVDVLTGKSAVMHMFTFHPTDHWYGLAPTAAGAYAIDAHNEISRWNVATMQNSATPSGAMVIKGDAAVLTDEQYNRLDLQIQTKMQGARNAQKPLILEGGMEWQPMSLTPKELDFINNKSIVAREICQAYGFPPLLLGLPGDNTYANYAEARIALYEDTVIPMLEKAVKCLNNWLAPMFGDDVYIGFDLGNVSALEVKKEKAFDSAVRAVEAGIMTIEEARQKIGLDVRENTDVLLVSTNKVPLDMAGEEAQKMAEELASAGFSPDSIKSILISAFGNASKN